MPVFDLFSTRRKLQRGEVPDVFAYDVLPIELRVQVVHVITDALGPPGNGISDEYYEQMHDIISRERGRFSLGEADHYCRVDKSTAFINYFLQEKNVDRAMDCVELAARMVVAVHKDVQRVAMTRPRVSSDDAIEELNARFRQHGVGYEFSGNEIIRVDSSLIHDSAVKPALFVLRDKRYAAAEIEFLRAHEHYRHNRLEEALTDALKSFESVLKVICLRHAWKHSETDTAKGLLNAVFTNGLVPAYLQSEFSALRTTLECGVPTVRNREGGHGSGAKPRVLPRHLVSYAMHLTAASLLFLVEADAALP